MATPTKGSNAEIKRIICLEDGWNLTKRSFFFISFSQWKSRVSLAFVFICSRAPTWRAIETLRRSRLFGTIPTWLFPSAAGIGAAWLAAATTAGNTDGAPAGGWGAPYWTLRGMICWE